MAPKDESVLILGAGTFGLATAHSLAIAGYGKITVLEKDSQIPSRFSGGFDLNKIIRCEYADPFYTDLALQAVKKWQTDPLYQPHFRQTGFLNVASGDAKANSIQALQKYHKSVVNHPGFAGMIVPCPDAQAIKKLVPRFTGELRGWHGYLNRLAGYAHSSNAMQAVYEECLRLGVDFHLGPEDGDAVELLYDSVSGKCTGARTRSGAIHHADRTIVALGGNVCRLLPSIRHQAFASCWGVSHIQLTDEEAEKLRGIPVTTVRDIGFFFEPDPATKKLKICHMGGGYTNYGGKPLSLPYSTLEESEYMPQEDVDETRRMLRFVFPHLAERPLIDQHLCWIADNALSDYVIDYVPNTEKSLVVLSGDSGHGFKMMPIFGSWVLDLLTLKAQTIPRWQWKSPEKEDTTKKVSWRASETVDLSTLSRAKL